MRLLSARLLNRIGAAHGADPRVGIQLKDFDKLAVHEKGHTFRKPQTIEVSSTKSTAWKLGNTVRVKETYHTGMMAAIGSFQREHPGFRGMTASPVRIEFLDWWVEKHDPWRDYGGEA